MISNEILEWDSNFFRRKIALIEREDATYSNIKREIQYLLHIGIECIYIYTNKPINLMDYDAILADRKRIYLLSNPEYNKIEDVLPFDKPKFNGTPSELYNLALQAGEHSRFKKDPHFSEEEFKCLYKKWVDNSIYEGFADYVFVYANPDPQGFITAKIKNDKMVIGLFATDSKYRGRGIGTLLIQEVINISAEKKLKVEVATQADNKVACRFYEKMGFEVSEETCVYHVWNTQNQLKN